MSQRVKHWPTLNTVIMVEKVLKDMDESVITVAELKRRVPRKINHNTLIVILKYLEESNKIAFGVSGMTWVQNRNYDLKKAVSSGLEL